MDEEDLIPFTEDDDPCDACSFNCDGWNAQFCCTRCIWLGQNDCDNCDRDDI